MVVERFYRIPALSSGAHETTLRKLEEVTKPHPVQLDTELCFYVDNDGETTGGCPLPSLRSACLLEIF